MNALRLSVELVPSTAWYSNLRNRLPKKDWDKIRHRTYAEYEYRCSICSVASKLNCHEIWEYDDTLHIQRLAGFVALCDWCHHVKHLGFAAILAARGQLDYEKLIEHFLRVNDCDRNTFEEHSKNAFEVWERRSRHEWRTDLGKYTDMVTTSNPET